MTCHFCGAIKAGDSVSWWNLREYRCCYSHTGLTGLACADCYTELELRSNEEIANLVTSRKVAEVLTKEYDDDYDFPF